MFSVIVNGEPHQFDQPVTLAELLQQMALAGKRIAVEKNGAIIPRSTFEKAALSDGDRLEIVVAVGGG
ncbi:MAG TPA: sulfur carrier protein ThiS [Burkholderiales bacterium]|nr:sulfur carrier protein ThiS [Burkholderiales bacterium]